MEKAQATPVVHAMMMIVFTLSSGKTWGGRWRYQLFKEDDRVTFQGVWKNDVVHTACIAQNITQTSVVWLIQTVISRLPRKTS